VTEHGVLGKSRTQLATLDEDKFTTPQRIKNFLSAEIYTRDNLRLRQIFTGHTEGGQCKKEFLVFQ
jgi:hypothetical protein